VVLANARTRGTSQYVGKRLSDIAKAQAKSPEDAAWELVAEGDGRVMAIYHMMGEQDVETALRFPWISIGSDAARWRRWRDDATGLPHPARLRQRGARDLALREGSEGADAGGRGAQDDVVARHAHAPRRPRPDPRGMWADVTIFDLAALDDRATYDRPMEFPTGIDWVLVNGVVTIDRGRHTGAKAGHVLRGPGARTKR
jgi:N-acyl-D-aspartate/D-glutamate deacylase